MDRVRLMAEAAAKLRKMRGHCRMCGSADHTTMVHARRAVAARVKSVLWQTRVAESNKEKKSGKPSWNKGIKGSVPGRSSDPKVEVKRRRRISQHHKGRKQPWCTGENHWRWKGGPSRSCKMYRRKYNHRFKTLRPVILKRDKDKCVMCRGKRKTKRGLVIHHIDGPRNNPKNLVAVCHPCNVTAEAKAKRNKVKRWLTLYTQEANERIAA